MSVSRRAAADAEARLADDFLDGYVYWREACDAVRAAYERWRGGQRPDRPAAFAVYQAALDEEERAALAFGARTAQMSESVDQEPW